MTFSLEILSKLLPDAGGEISEHDLLCLLRKGGYVSKARTDLELYQQHFLLMNGLYRLQNMWFECEIAILEITSIQIKILNYQPGKSALTINNSVKNYYLDLNNLTSATEDSVDSLLKSFWTSYTQYHDRNPALKILGLNENATKAMIKKQAQRLTMKHHPDRGGDADMLIKIRNAASQLLG